MNRSVALAYALSLLNPERKVVCLCTYCLEDLDPRGDVPAHKAPPSSECERCSDRVRWAMGGFVFAVMPAGV